MTQRQAVKLGLGRASRVTATVLFRRRLVFVAAGALFVTLAFLAADPAPAQAWILGLPSPGQVISSLVGGIGHVIGGTVGKLAVTAFDAIVHALFAPIAHFINTQLLGWLVAVPDYAAPGSHVAATEQTVLAMAGAALGAVATISIARYWAAGVAGGGASALEGLARTVGAALLLPLWPWIFHTAVALSNAASTGLLGSGSVTKVSANLLAVGVGAGVGLGFLGVGLFVSIVMAVIATVMFLGLLMLKVVLAISTVLVFVGMPLAIVLSPAIPWIARVLARAFLVCLAVPLVWSLCFAAGGALLNDSVFLKGSPGLFDALLKPLAAIALLWVLLLLPTRLAQSAMLGANAVRGGFVSRAASYAAGSHLREVTRQHLPGWAGGQAGGGAGAGVQRTKEIDSRLGARLRAESTVAASKAAGANGAFAAAGAATARTAAGGVRRRSGQADGERVGEAANGAAERLPGWVGRMRRSGSSRAYSPPPVLARAEGALGRRGGLQRPSWRQHDFEAEMLAARLREQHAPVSAEQAQQARDTLPSATQDAVGALVEHHGPRARQHLAYQALGEWAPQEREALRTLAAASPEVREQVFGGSTAGFGESAEPQTTAASSATVATASGAERPSRAGSSPSDRTPGGARSSRDGSSMPPPTPKPGADGNAGTSPRPPRDQPPTSDGGGS